MFVSLMSSPPVGDARIRVTDYVTAPVSPLPLTQEVEKGILLNRMCSAAKPYMHVGLAR